MKNLLVFFLSIVLLSSCNKISNSIENKFIKDFTNKDFGCDYKIISIDARFDEGFPKYKIYGTIKVGDENNYFEGYFKFYNNFIYSGTSFFIESEKKSSLERRFSNRVLNQPFGIKTSKSTKLFTIGDEGKLTYQYDGRKYYGEYQIDDIHQSNDYNCFYKESIDCDKLRKLINPNESIFKSHIVFTWKDNDGEKKMSGDFIFKGNEILFNGRLNNLSKENLTEINEIYYFQSI
ncbi:MAG: hypothetical protein ACOYO1_08030 [Bacteroidales bacterium]